MLNKYNLGDIKLLAFDFLSEKIDEKSEKISLNRAAVTSEDKALNLKFFAITAKSIIDFVKYISEQIEDKKNELDNSTLQNNK